jgi:hypothetical protein
LAARLGVDPRVRLSFVDAAHVYVGLVGGIFVLAKVSRVWFHYKVSGVPEVVPWQRWISWSLLVLYSAVFLSGVLLLTPIRGVLYGDLVNFHLLSSVWAIAPTTWHVWHYRRRAAPYLTRILPRGRSLRYWAGVALAILPAVAVIANARSLSQLPQVLGGSSWSAMSLDGSYLDRITIGPNGTLIAAGDALYVSPDGVAWTQIDIPAAATPSSGSPGSMQMHGAPMAGNLGLSLASSGNTIYVGTRAGLYKTDSITGPLQPFGFEGDSVNAIAVDPTDARSIWVGSSAGIVHSADAGVSWQPAAAGLKSPNSVTALGFLGSRLFASDSTGVFAWDLDMRQWLKSSAQPSVIDLAADPDGKHLYATSSTQGVRILDDSGWHATASLASPHQHHSGNEMHPQVLSVAPIEGRLYAVGTAFGVSASDDRGQTWTQLGGGLANVEPSQLVDYQGSLLAATSNGVFRFPLAGSQPASGAWWIALIASVVLCGSAGVALVGMGRGPRIWRVLSRPGSQR